MAGIHRLTPPRRSLGYVLTGRHTWITGRIRYDGPTPSFWYRVREYIRGW